MENNTLEALSEIESIKKRYYLIDYENVNHAGLGGISTLTENDTLIIFYTINAENLTFSMYQKFIACPAKIEIQRVDCGEKNALDFQLSTFMGYIIGTEKNAEFYIISNDKGYGYLRKFWKNRGVDVKLFPSIGASQFDSMISELSLTQTERDKFFNIFISNIQQKNANSCISNEIGKTFGSNNQKAYYTAVKPLI